MEPAQAEPLQPVGIPPGHARSPPPSRNERGRKASVPFDQRVPGQCGPDLPEPGLDVPQGEGRIQILSSGTPTSLVRNH